MDITRCRDLVLRDLWVRLKERARYRSCFSIICNLRKLEHVVVTNQDLVQFVYQTHIDMQQATCVKCVPRRKAMSVQEGGLNLASSKSVVNCVRLGRLSKDTRPRGQKVDDNFTLPVALATLTRRSASKRRCMHRFKAR